MVVQQWRQAANAIRPLLYGDDRSMKE